MLKITLIKLHLILLFLKMTNSYVHKFTVNTTLRNKEKTSFTKTFTGLNKTPIQLKKYQKLVLSTQGIGNTKITTLHVESLENQTVVYWGDSPSFNETYAINKTEEKFIKNFELENKMDWHPDPRFRIYGGRKASIGQIPYQVSIRYEKEHSCGGSIISESFVLTAAHCLYEGENTIQQNFRDADPVNLENLKIWAGGIEFDDDLWSTWGARNSISHDTADLGLIQIDGSFSDATPRLLKPVVLPFQGESHENEICIISGWGYTSRKPKLSSSLQLAEVEIFPQARCYNVYRKFLTYGDHMICAGLREKLVDACLGDSGGPLACNNILVGVISMGAECGQPNFPGIYTNVSQFRDWINIVMRKLDRSGDLARSISPSIFSKSVFLAIFLNVLSMFCNHLFCK